MTISAGNAASVTTTTQTPVSNAGATTQGTAYGADADVLILPGIDQLGKVHSQAPGAPAHDQRELANITVASVVGLNLVTNTSDSSVANEATSTAASQVAGVNLLNGVVQADVVRAESTSTPTPPSPPPARLAPRSPT